MTGKFRRTSAVDGWRGRLIRRRRRRFARWRFYHWWNRRRWRCARAMHRRLMAWSAANGYTGCMSGREYRRWFNATTGADLPDKPIYDFYRAALEVVDRQAEDRRP